MGRFIDITGAPIASDFQEMPLDFMSKALDVKQKSLDTFRSDADKGLPVDVGLRTEWVKKYADETYTPELERIAKNAVANPQGAGRELTSLRTKMAKDPFIAKAKQDAAAREFVTKNEYTLKQAGKPIFKYRDAQGNIMQMSKEDLLNKDFDLGTWYDATPFGDYDAQFKKDLNLIKPKITDIDWTSNPKIVNGPDGIVLMQTTKGGTKTTKLNETTLGTQLNNYVDSFLASDNAEARFFKDRYGINASNVDSKEVKELAKRAVLNQWSLGFQNDIATESDVSNTVLDKGIYDTERQSKIPSVLPFDSQVLKGEMSYDNFATTTKNAKLNRDMSWAGVAKNLRAISPTILSAAGIKLPASGALIENDLSKVIDLANSSLASKLSDPDRLALNNAKKDAIAYFANKNQSDFYNKTIEKALDDAYNETKNKSANQPFGDSIDKDYKAAKEAFKRGDFDLDGLKFNLSIKGLPTIKNSPFYRRVKEKIENDGSLSLSNSYVLMNKATGDYSPESKALADNAFNRAMSGGIVFEGMKNKGVQGVNELFKDKTGAAPSGKLTSEGSALDANGRIGVIVKDQTTGNVATFVVPNRLEYVPTLKQGYATIASSNDPYARSVGKQGYFDTELTEFGLTPIFNNFTEAKYPSTFDFGNTVIKNDGKQNFSLQTPDGKPLLNADGSSDLITGVENLKEYLGNIRLNP